MLRLPTALALSGLLAGLLAPGPLPAREDLSGSWQEDYDEVVVAVEQWSAPCGEAPRTPGRRERKLRFEVQDRGVELLFTAPGGARFSSTDCQSPNPEVKPKERSLRDDLFLISCSTAEDAREYENGLYSFRVQTGPRLEYRETSRYARNQEDAQCVYTRRVRRMYSRLAASEPAPEPAAPPDAGPPSGDQDQAKDQKQPFEVKGEGQGTADAGPEEAPSGDRSPRPGPPRPDPRQPRTPEPAEDAPEAGAYVNALPLAPIEPAEGSPPSPLPTDTVSSEPPPPPDLPPRRNPPPAASSPADGGSWLLWGGLAGGGLVAVLLVIVLLLGRKPRWQPPPPPPPQEEPPAEVFCTGCGKQLPHGARFCPHCSQKVG